MENVIQSLDSNKAHGHGMISIRMLKICGKSIIKSLLIIYKKCLEKGCFPNEWKNANVVLFIKKWQAVTKKLSTNISFEDLS